MEISPKTLEFSSPFTIQSHTSVVIRNNTDQRYAFKVKTTAPKRYFVRPNASIVEPGETQSVSIILQPYEEELPEDYKCNDKFLVMQCEAPNEVTMENFAEFWSLQEHAPNSKMSNKKIRVHYDIRPTHEIPGLIEARKAGMSGGQVRGSDGSPEHYDEQGAGGFDGSSSISSQNAAASVVSGNSVPAESAPQVPVHSQFEQGYQQEQPQPINPIAQESKSDFGRSDDTHLSEAVNKASDKIKAFSEELNQEKATAFGTTTSNKPSTSEYNEKSAFSSSTPASNNKNAISQTSVTAKKILERNNEIPLPYVVLLVIISFLIGWFFF